MSEHTQGPWEMEYGTQAHVFYVRAVRDQADPSYHALIARVTQRYHGNHPAITAENAEANARLIAAAPDLLDALRGALNLMYCKAGPEWYSETCDCVACEAIRFGRAAITKTERGA